MYSTCIYCQKDLARNEVIEHFPVGRRLAFDEARGRLWVVCRNCERWNLSPLETRWEAIEECERTFRDTRLRMSTDNIGLARVSEGLELVRVGEPLRPEIAAWRYGDQFGRRRRKTMLAVGAGVAVIGTVAAGAAATGIGLGSIGGFWNLPAAIWRRRVQARVRTRDGRILEVRGEDLGKIKLAPSGTGPLRLEVFHKEEKHPEWFTGDEVTRVAGILMPRINRTGGNKRTVNNAVRDLGTVGHADDFVTEIISSLTPRRTTLHRLPAERRLAFEMALHESQERRALTGELAILEAAWRDAEEIAHIADNMFVSDDSQRMLDRMKRNGRGALPG